MRLLFLNRSFWPDLEATGQLLTELCTDLSERHDVTVISGPSYHVATAHRGLWQRDALGRVRVIRTWGTRLAKRRLAGRLVNLGTYYAIAAIAALGEQRPDVVVTETDPPLLGVLGAALKARWGCRFVYYCQDVYPDVAAATGGLSSKALLGLLETSNRRAFTAADLVVAIGEDMRERLIAKGIAAGKIAVVPNWVDCAEMRAVAPNAFRDSLGAGFVVMYAGNLGLTQSFDEILEAARSLAADPGIVFVFVGEGARKTALQDRVSRLGLANVRFFPYQPKDRLAEVLSAADLHVIPLRSGLGGCLVPSKAYPILAVGRPFVAIMEPQAEIARLAREYRVGSVVGPGATDDLTRAIAAARANPDERVEMGARARRLAVERFDRRLVTGRIAELLEQVGGPP